MKRRIIQIDEERCNGCGACANACHEGAIVMENGKAKLIRDDYCDGLGDCLPTCPTGAIQFVVREAAAYDEAAVQARKKQHAGGGCPGMAAKTLEKDSVQTAAPADAPSCLQQWPVQIKLAPLSAPYFDGAKILIAADCSAYAYAAFHQKFMNGFVTLIGCPKLDGVNYAEKLTEIFRNNAIEEVHLVRMEVPCCGGMEYAVKTALQDCGKEISLKVTILSLDGKILS